MPVDDGEPPHPAFSLSGGWPGSLARKVEGCASRSCLFVLVLLGALAFHFSTGLGPRALEWSGGREGDGQPLPLVLREERNRRFTCHESSGDNVPFSVERTGRRCWRVVRTVTIRGGKAGTEAARDCYDGWDRVERELGAARRSRTSEVRDGMPLPSKSGSSLPCQMTRSARSRSRTRSRHLAHRVSRRGVGSSLEEGVVLTALQHRRPRVRRR